MNSYDYILTNREVSKERRYGLDGTRKGVVPKAELAV